MTMRRFASILLVLLSLGLLGCGRIGFALLPAPESRDSGPVDPRDASADTGDADPDASMADADPGIPKADPLDPGETDVCIRGECASDTDRCPGSSMDWANLCGCDEMTVDSDGDGTPDCVDECPDYPDRIEGGECGCEAARVDSDDDGVENCNDACPYDPEKLLPGICGCGMAETDADGDGMPDCGDPCPDDPDKFDPGACDCGVVDGDMDGDEILDCVDTCGGLDDSNYEVIDTCGVGYCLTTNTPSSCVDGIETACAPGAPLAADDATCDGIDDDCDGEIDEDYVTDASCGTGACQAANTPSSCVGGVEMACQAGSPTGVTEAMCNGIDDDCNGSIDEGETRTWLSFLGERSISWANWSLHDKDEACSAVRPTGGSTGPWGNDQLTASGLLVKSQIP